MPILPKGKRKKWVATKKARFNKKKHESENSDFYNSRAWRRLRDWHINRFPICKWCEEEGKLNIKERMLVDHIVEISDGGDRLDPNNLQTLCLSHHTQKTNWARAKRKKA
jgi:5-methylcytosine-specific restriction protein A